MKAVVSGIILIVAHLWGVHGQVEAEGLFQVSSFLKTIVSEEAIHRLPEQDNALLTKVADEENDGVTYKFAQSLEYRLDISKDGEWSVDENTGTKKWRAQIESIGAVSMSLLFEEFHLPFGSEFYVIGKHRIHGAYTAEHNNMDDRKFAVGLVKGDSVILEYIEPAAIVDTAVIKLHKVVHGFRMGTRYGMSGPCNIDVACADGAAWRDQINSVGLLLTNEGQRFCTGAMINNVRQDGTQYFLTANHCIFADISYFMVGFDYQWPYCRSGGSNGTATEPPMLLVQGLRLVTKWDKSDYALLLVKEKIPDSYNVFLAGWDQRPVPALNAVGIHHPSGDVKKISTYIGMTQQSSWTEFPAKYHWLVPRWTRGITEPGSSGSPLFNSKGLVIGHLHGGQSACNFPTGYDMYGGVAWDWASPPSVAQRLGTYLNPTKLNVTSIGGVYLKAARTRTKSLAAKMLNLEAH